MSEKASRTPGHVSATPCQRPRYIYPAPTVPSEAEVLSCISPGTDAHGFKWPVLSMRQSIQRPREVQAGRLINGAGHCLEEFLCSSEHLFSFEYLVTQSTAYTINSSGGRNLTNPFRNDRKTANET